MEVPGKISEIQSEVHELTEEKLCEPCKADNKETKDCGVCIQCEDVMCFVCFKHHLKARSCRNHTFFGTERSSTTSAHDENLEKCKQHGNETIKFYSRSHNVVGCGECMLMGGHKGCEQEYIRDFGNNYQNSEEFLCLAKRIENLQLRNSENTTLIQKNMVYNTEMKEKAVADVKTFITDLRNHLGTAEKELFSSVDHLHTENESLLDAAKLKCKVTGSDIKSVKQTLNTEHYSENALFINSVNSKKKLNHIEENLKDAATYIVIKKIEFKTNEDLAGKLRDPKAFGTLSAESNRDRSRCNIRDKIKERDGAPDKNNMADQCKRSNVPKCVERQFSGIQIFVRDVGGQTVTLKVKLSDFVKDLKAKIQDETGILIELQRLIYTGTQLEDDHTVSDYEIEKESALHLLIRAG